jgi:hypothetical protein
MLAHVPCFSGRYFTFSSTAMSGQENIHGWKLMTTALLDNCNEYDKRDTK